MERKDPLKESLWGKELHKLNNSLGAILGFSSLLRRHLAEDPIGSDYANKIGEAVRDALDRAGVLADMELEVRSKASGEEGSSALEVSSHSEAFVPQSPSLQPTDSGSIDPLLDVDWPHLGGCERLLIVEDDSAFRSLLKTFLCQLGYELVCAEDGIEALELFSSQPQSFDLVCLDRGLPRMSGLSVASKIRELRPRIRMVLLSGTMLRGSSQEENQEELQDLGFAAVLNKPIPLGELAQALRRVLDQPTTS